MSEHMVRELRRYRILDYSVDTSAQLAQIDTSVGNHIWSVSTVGKLYIALIEYTKSGDIGCRREAIRDNIEILASCLRAFQEKVN